MAIVHILLSSRTLVVHIFDPKMGAHFISESEQQNRIKVHPLGRYFKVKTNTVF